jgi:hypothetical protein
MAEASIFINCASILAVFDISKKVVDGVEVTPIHEQLTGTIRCVTSYFLSIPQIIFSSTPHHCQPPEAVYV